MATDRIIKVRVGERIDQIAERAFNGDPLKFIRILEQNPDVNLFYPLTDQYLKVNDDQ